LRHGAPAGSVMLSNAQVFHFPKPMSLPAMVSVTSVVFGLSALSCGGFSPWAPVMWRRAAPEQLMSVKPRTRSRWASRPG
jgi:hypothetical protein